MGVRLRRAFVVPDPQAWASWGWDLERRGIQPVVSPEQAALMLVPSAMPPALADAVADVASRIPPGAMPMVLPGPNHLDLIAAAPDGGHGGHEGHNHGDHEGHGDHDHDGHKGHGDHEGNGDMMAIVGDPSSDGLIMEDVELTLGPLGAALPGGLVARFTLDGDVVTGVVLDATLRAVGVPADPLTPLAWRAVLAAADGRTGPGDLVAVEVERALSHVAWLRSMGSVLGLGTLDRASAMAVRFLIPARNAATPAGERLPQLIEEAVAATRRVEELCAGDRGLRARLGGLAVVEEGALERRRVGGPAARAAGLVRDARQRDARYDGVDFAPVLESGSDALARTRVHAREASAALGLALELLRQGGGAPGSGRLPAVVEGPRGPLHAIAARGGTPAVAAPGQAALLELAAASVVGLELSSALAGLVSFDLSPWRVGG